MHNNPVTNFQQHNAIHASWVRMAQIMFALKETFYYGNYNKKIK